MGYVKKLFFTFFLSICAVLAFAHASQAQSVPTPLIRSIASGPVETGSRPVITGETATNTEVLFYVDGTYAGMADVTGPYYAPEFVYRQPFELVPGEHRIMAIARDLTSLVLSPPTREFAITVSAPYTEPEYPGSSIPAPTIITPEEGSTVSDDRPQITGFTESGTNVEIYLDGERDGETGTLTHESGTAHFEYTSKILAPGKHEAGAVAKDAEGRRSLPAHPTSFDVEHPIPAPTLVSAVKRKANDSQPLVTGLAKNGSYVRVFVDGRLDGEFEVEPHVSGTASFAYRIAEPLSPGMHAIYTTAVAATGKESIWSNSLRIEVASRYAVYYAPSGQTANEPASPRPSEEAVSGEEKQPVSGEKIIKPQTEEEKQADEKSRLSDILEKIGVRSATSPEEEATTSDSQENRKKLSLIIFLVFLVGVIAWIFWVNRELVKERKRIENENRNEPGPKTGPNDNQPGQFS